MQNFNELGLSGDILRALQEMGFETPTEIQKLSVPALTSEATDLLGMAQTGTGKTAAFGLPLVELASAKEEKVIRSLVLSPTRELAIQIKDNIDAFAKYIPHIKSEVVYGGASIQQQMRDIKRNKPQIVIATPGRLIDLIDRKVIFLDQIERVVLDEADEMLNMGFQEDIDRILEETPDERNIWLFSATMPKEIRHLIKRYMHNPVEVSSNSKQTVNTNIEHRYVRVKKNDRSKALQFLIEYYTDLYGVVFCRTRMETQKVAEDLHAWGYAAEALNGDMSQAFREAVMKRFRSGKTRLLIATDVAARGIDVDNLTHVIHYALPDDTTYYTHRSGRTARAGKKGMSIALIDPREERRLRHMQDSLGIKMELMQIPSRDEILSKRLENRQQELMEQELPDLPVELIDSFFEKFQMVDPNELLEKLLISDLVNQMKGLPERDVDLNAKKGEKKKNEYRDPNGAETIFMNMGRIDGFNKGSLLDTIRLQTGLRNSQIGKVEIQKNITFVEVAPEVSAQFLEGFKDFELNGRAIRVNNDADPISDNGKGGRPRGRKGGGGGDRKGGGYKGKSRSGGGGGNYRGGGGGSRSSSSKGRGKGKRY